MISPEELKNILNFVGYGNLDAPLWFLGVEEGTGKKPRRISWSLAWELQVRASWSPVMDMYAAHSSLNNFYQVTLEFPWAWVLIARLTRGILHHAPDWRRFDEANGYILNHLGRAASDTLLGEALPLPFHYRQQWPNEYRALYPGRKEYEQAVLPTRFAMWQELIERHRPGVVICYGTLWHRNQDVFIDQEWHRLTRRVVTTTYLLHTQVYIIPFFDREDSVEDDLAAVVAHAAQD
jgi:hypothetical protein